MKRLLGLAAPLILLAVTLCPAGEAGNRNITFISTSDSHYKLDPTWNSWNRETLTQLNAIADVAWPDSLGGGRIGRPRGVVVLGDCIDDGDKMIENENATRKQYDFFIADFGVDGTDGFVKFPVFETWGNHDGPPEGKEKFGFSFQANLKKRNQQRLEKKLISNLSANGLHYSWDWDDVHFVQLGIYPADKQREGVRYSPVWHDPQGALTFLKDDLAKNVGDSGRPVVLLSHCGFDTNWWIEGDWKDVYDAVTQYNIILYLYGHTGTGLRAWAPESETKKWTCINDGNTTAGFFVIQIDGTRIRAAYRTRANVTTTKNPDKTVTRTWDGSWGWKFEMKKEL